jgi:hypothetical protein
VTLNSLFKITVGEIEEMSVEEYLEWQVWIKFQSERSNGK